MTVCIYEQNRQFVTWRWLCEPCEEKRRKAGWVSKRIRLVHQKCNDCGKAAP